MKTIKRVVTYILALAMAVSMVACHKAPEADPPADVELKYVEKEIQSERPDLTLEKKGENIYGLRDFLLGLLGLGQPQPEPKPEPKPIAAETVAPSMHAQAEQIAEAFLDIPELQYDAWKELTVDERLSALCELEEDVADIVCREEIPVLIDDLGDHTYGMYDTDDNTITIDDDLMEADSREAYIETMDTYFHEGRHAYQFYNLYEEEVEPNAQLIEAWRINIDVLGYEAGDSGYYGYEKYYTQPIEVDARVFAEEVLVTLALR